MPLFYIKGLPEDNTYSFESNPDPDKYVEVKAKPAPKNSDQADAPAETKKDEA